MRKENKKSSIEKIILEHPEEGAYIKSAHSIPKGYIIYSLYPLVEKECHYDVRELLKNGSLPYADGDIRISFVHTADNGSHDKNTGYIFVNRKKEKAKEGKILEFDVKRGIIVKYSTYTNDLNILKNKQCMPLYSFLKKYSRILSD